MPSRDELTQLGMTAADLGIECGHSGTFGFQKQIWETKCLPREDEMADLQMLPAQKKPKSVEKPQILVVDDNQDAAHTLTRLLNLIGYSASSAFDGEAAISAIESSSPTLVFLDLGMPVMDGVETAKRIRQMPNGGEIILVALTGREGEEDIARTRAAGFVAHLVKPVNLALLEQSLCDLVGVPADGRRPFPK